METSSGMVLACPSHFASFEKLSGSTVWEVLQGYNPEILIWAKLPLFSVGGLLALRPSTPQLSQMTFLSFKSQGD